MEKREPFRQDHIQHANGAVRSGILEQAGALADPVDQAVFVFTASDASTVQKFADADPYFLNGLVTRVKVREWSVVVNSSKTQEGK